MRIDVLIRNARIVAEAATPWFRSDVGMDQGRILFFDSGASRVRIFSTEASGRTSIRSDKNFF